MLLALLFGLMLFVGLVLLSQGMLLPLAVVGAAVFVFIGFHYLVWGWWLGGAIRREVKSEEEEEQARGDSKSLGGATVRSHEDGNDERLNPNG